MMSESKSSEVATAPAGEDSAITRENIEELLRAGRIERRGWDGAWEPIYLNGFVERFDDDIEPDGLFNITIPYKTASGDIASLHGYDFDDVGNLREEDSYYKYRIISDDLIITRKNLKRLLIAGRIERQNFDGNWETIHPVGLSGSARADEFEVTNPFDLAYKTVGGDRYSICDYDFDDNSNLHQGDDSYFKYRIKPAAVSSPSGDAFASLVEITQPANSLFVQFLNGTITWRQYVRERAGREYRRQLVAKTQLVKYHSPMSKRDEFADKIATAVVTKIMSMLYRDAIILCIVAAIAWWLFRINLFSW